MALRMPRYSSARPKPSRRAISVPQGSLRTTVGKASARYLWAISGWRSTSTLRQTNLLASDTTSVLDHSWTSISRQGWHQVAQKSMRTGFPWLRATSIASSQRCRHSIAGAVGERSADHANVVHSSNAVAPSRASPLSRIVTIIFLNTARGWVCQVEPFHPPPDRDKPQSGSRQILARARLVRVNLLDRRDGDPRPSRARQRGVERHERRLRGCAPQLERMLEPLVARGQRLTLRLRRCGVAAIEVIVQRTKRIGDRAQPRTRVTFAFRQGRDPIPQGRDGRGRGIMVGVGR